MRKADPISMRWSVGVILLATSLLSLVWAPARSAPPVVAEPAVSASKVDSLIETLEDPAARERLIQQIKLLVEAEQATATEHALPAFGADLLKALSDRLATLGDRVLHLPDIVEELPSIIAWIERQATDPQARALWIEVLLKLTAVLGLGYLAFYVIRRAVARPNDAIATRAPGTVLPRASLLLLTFLVDLVPIAAFALVAFGMLGLVDPSEKTRIIALAWINASIVVRLGLAVARAFLAPQAPSLRLLPVSDETAHYAEIWARRLTFTPVFGYLALQAALLLGLPVSAYDGLLRLLGLIVTALVVVLILQNRAGVAAWIRGRGVDAAQPRWYTLRHRLAQAWTPLAIVYVVLLYGIWALGVTDGFLFLLRGTLFTLALGVLGWLALRLLDAALSRGLRISADLKARFPGLEARTNRYLPALRMLLRGVVYALLALAILQAWSVDTFAWVLSDTGEAFVGAVVSVVAIVVVSVAIWELASSAIEGYLAEQDGFGQARVRSARTRTLLTVARNALMVVLVVVSSLLVLSELGVNIAPLLAGAGVIGLAIGFGSQKLVQDVITGVFILFEDLIGVGDVVQVGDKGGLVEALSIRNVRLRDLSGTVHTIPFSTISTISNLTKDFAYYVFDVRVAYRQDVDQVMDVLKGIGGELQQDPEFAPVILEPLEMLGLDAFGDSAVIVKARIKTKPIKQWTVGREFNRRMKKRFDALGIKIPYPHRTLYFGADKEGGTPAARLRREMPRNAQEAG